VTTGATVVGMTFCFYAEAMAELPSVRVKTGQMGESVEEHVVGIVRSTLDLIVKVEITDIEIMDCSVSSGILLLRCSNL